MFTGLFNQRHMQIAKMGLEASALRHSVIANNIANVNTPGFKRSEVAFEEYLRRAMMDESFRGKRTRPAHIEIGAVRLESLRPRIFEPDDTIMRNDGNNVDIDVEMANLSTNSIWYRAIMNGLDTELSKISNAITRGGRV